MHVSKFCFKGSACSIAANFNVMRTYEGLRNAILDFAVFFRYDFHIANFHHPSMNMPIKFINVT